MQKNLKQLYISSFQNPFPYGVVSGGVYLRRGFYFLILTKTPIKRKFILNTKFGFFTKSLVYQIHGENVFCGWEGLTGKIFLGYLECSDWKLLNKMRSIS